MTSGSLNDDDAIIDEHTISDHGDDVVDPQDERARVGSDDFVESMLSVAERRVEADEPQPTQSPVHSRVESDDFIDAVLEVAETRAVAAIRDRPQREREARERELAATVEAKKSQPAPAVAREVQQTRAQPMTVTADARVASKVAVEDDAVAVAEVAETQDESSPHVHPSLATPWWRKRPSLELIFAAIATVLMVIGLALVIAELF